MQDLIRKLLPEEIDQMLELVQRAFAVEFTEEELAHRRQTAEPDQFWGYYLDGKLAAQVAVLPLSVYIQGEEYEMGGIAHVCSYPELRRRGMVGKLLAASLEGMRAAGQTVSMLNPFAHAFYRKYGWENFCDVRSCSVDLAELRTIPAAAGSVRRLGREDWAVLDAVYDVYARRYSGMLRRSEKTWQSITFRRKTGSIAVYSNPLGEPTGYLIYTIGNGTFQVQELVALDEDALRGLLRFVLNHDSIAQKLSFRAPIDDAFAFRLPNPAVSQNIVPHFMVRIVDVGGFVRRYRFGPGAPGERLTIAIADEHAGWNQGTWALDRRPDGSVEATPLGPDVPAELSCDIGALSAMMVGYQRPMTLYRMGRLTGSEEQAARWEQLIPLQAPYLADMF